MAAATQLQLNLETCPVVGYESMIHRVPAGRNDLYTWKKLRADGWDVTALRAPDGTMILLAYRAHG